MNLLIGILLVTLAFGCRTEGPREAATSTNTEATTTARDFEIKTGLHSEGEAYDRLLELMSEANTKIRLDVHSGILWNANQKIADIDDLSTLMQSIDNKSVVVISTGKAMWGKEDEYIETIVAFAKEFGYKLTIVIDDHSSGIFVRKTIPH